jgi:putative oxidoreductase
MCVRGTSSYRYYRFTRGSREELIYLHFATYCIKLATLRLIIKLILFCTNIDYRMKRLTDRIFLVTGAAHGLRHKLAAFLDHDSGLLIFRVLVSLTLYINHGHEKLFHFSEMLVKIADPLHIGKLPGLLFATFSDVFCMTLVLIGFKTKVAALVITFNTLVAFVLVQHIDVTAFRGEIALLYFCCYLLISYIGPGLYSFDNYKKSRI